MMRHRHNICKYHTDSAAAQVVSTVPAGDRPQRRARLHHAGARRRSLRHLRRGVPAQRRGQLRQRALGGGAEGLLIP